MHRRQAIAVVAGAFARQASAAEAAISVVLAAESGRLLRAGRLDAAQRLLAPPGSTLKPLVLAALLDSDKLRPDETHACTGKLTIEGRSFACVHPRMSAPLDLTAALAYSCNEYVAHMAQRFSAGELARALARYGLASRTGLAANEVTGRIEQDRGTQLQALGERGVEVTLLEIAMAYRALAAKAPATVLQGLEDAVEFGTAQHARVAGVRVAGKTGSAGNGRWAWFAGFAPSRDARFVVAVLTQGSSGGADAAPIAGELLRAAIEGKL